MCRVDVRRFLNANTMHMPNLAFFVKSLMQWSSSKQFLPHTPFVLIQFLCHFKCMLLKVFFLHWGFLGRWGSEQGRTILLVWEGSCCKSENTRIAHSFGANWWAVQGNNYYFLSAVVIFDTELGVAPLAPAFSLGILSGSFVGLYWEFVFADSELLKPLLTRCV